MSSHELMTAMKQAGRLHVVHIGNELPPRKDPREFFPNGVPCFLKSRRFAMVLDNELHIRKYEDPSHGWLAVPMQWLEALSIVGKITGYSYLRGNTAYLEEDLDAITFRKAVEAAGYRLFVDYRHTNDRSSIRSYPSFTKVISEQTELAAIVVAELNNEAKGN